MSRTTWLYLLVEFGPIFAFFITGRLTTFYVAVAVLMSTTAIAIIISWTLERHIPFLPIVSAAFTLLGGAITLLYEAPDAIILSDTLYYLVVASTLGYSIYSRKLILKRLFGAVFAITDAGWNLLTWRWFTFLTMAAIANELVRITATPDFWVDYRFFKTILITIFGCYQFTLSKRFRIPALSNKWGLRKNNTP